MWGIVPPTGGKIGVSEIAAGLTAIFVPGGAPLRLEGIDVPLLGVSSGRAALYAILQSMAVLHPERDVVIIPAYTCYSVAAAVVRSGLKVKLVDVEPSTLAMDPLALERACDEAVLAVVHTELFGIIGPMDEYMAIARKTGAYLLEDSAQAYGANLRGNMAGTLGDVGIFSVGRGKPIRGIAGGVIVLCRAELHIATRETVAGWSMAGLWRRMLEVVRLCAYRICFHPALYRLLESIPALGIGNTEYDPEFYVGQLAPSQCRIAEAAAHRSMRERPERLKKIRRLTSPQGMMTTFEFPRCEGGEMGSVPRLPVLAANKAARDQAISAMRMKRIGASIMYPKALCCLDALSSHRLEKKVHCAGAEELAQRLFTLPVHELVGPQEIAIMREVLFTGNAGNLGKQDK